MKPLILDCETVEIDDTPDGRFPAPVGIALLEPGREPRYLAFGHPAGNNCTLKQASATVLAAVHRTDTLICHNIGFDVGVLEQHFSLLLGQMEWHDTQVLAFHEDPHGDLRLKPLAERYLGMPPDEREAVRDWLVRHNLVRKSATRAWAARICDAPGDLVAPYAIGDVVRTWALFQLWHPKYIARQGPERCWEGYARDMKATRVGRRMTERGVLIDRPLLARDTMEAEDRLLHAQDQLAKRFGMTTYDPNDREALADGIERTFGVDLPLTKTGRRSTNKDTLEDIIPPGPVKALIRYIGALAYDLKNYLRPWRAATDATGGRIHPHWSVTRSDEGGARSGRLASSPNFQNLRGVETTAALVEWLAGMFPEYDFWTPNIRGLVVPGRGRVLVGRDYSQIELRITAHFENGPMAANYRANPDWDLHAWVIERVLAMFGVKLVRRIAKNIGFGSIYGAGAGPIAKQSRISLSDAAAFKTMYFEALPSLAELMQAVQDTSRVRAIHTLGWRYYRAEPSRFSEEDGRPLHFFYKMLNYLIQGSAADLMKEAMIDADEFGVPLILSVHDEPVSESDKAEADDHLEALRVAMEHNDLISDITVPITSNGYVVSRWSLADK